MSPQGTEYFTKLDAAGQIPTATNNLLYQALQLLEPNHPARTLVQQAAEANSGIGKRLEDLESFGRKAFPEPTAPATSSGLRPGEMVVDAGGAGEATGHGTVPFSAMSDANWSYYQQKNLGPHWADIFLGGNEHDLGVAIGARPGNLTTAGEDPIVRDAQGNQIADLSTFG